MGKFWESFLTTFCNTRLNTSTGHILGDGKADSFHMEGRAEKLDRISSCSLHRLDNIWWSRNVLGKKRTAFPAVYNTNFANQMAPNKLLGRFWAAFPLLCSGNLIDQMVTHLMRMDWFPPCPLHKINHIDRMGTKVMRKFDGMTPFSTLNWHHLMVGTCLGKMASISSVYTTNAENQMVSKI